MIFVFKHMWGRKYTETSGDEDFIRLYSVFSILVTLPFGISEPGYWVCKQPNSIEPQNFKSPDFIIKFDI